MNDLLHQRLRLRIEKYPDFGDLCANMDGASPQNIVKALLSAAAGPGSTARSAEQVLHSINTPTKDCRPVYDPRLPRPHPIEFEWRFTDPTNESLLEAANGERRAESIYFLGAPTTALFAADHRASAQLIVAARDDDVVANAVLAAAPQIQPYAVWNTRKLVQVDAAIVDPPWYDSIALAMLTQAISLVRPGGTVCWVGPNILTAPSAAQWFSDLRPHARAFGLVDVRPLDFAPRYDTPFFERRALVEHGLTNVDPQWRTGTAWIAQRCDSTVYHWLGSEKPAQALSEYEIDGSRIRFILDTTAPSRRAVLAPFNVLTSTSSADPARKGGTIWTSGNAVSKTVDPISVWQRRNTDFLLRKLKRTARDEASDFKNQMRPNPLPQAQSSCSDSTQIVSY